MLGRLGYRFKQVWFLLFARMKPEDRGLVNRYLNISEAALFNSLPAFEQKHAVCTAREMLRLGKPKGLDERLVVKIGLLHDVGKAACRLSLIQKGILVVLGAFLPPVYNWFAYLGRAEKAPLVFRRFYVHKKHARIGARLLSRAGVETGVIQAITAHSDRKTKNGSLLIKLLKAADEHY